MIRFACGLLLAVVIVAGCADSRDPAQQARRYVTSWRGSGASLPADQIPFFATNFDQTSSVLGAALTDRQEPVRQRAAYVIEGIGPGASSLEPALVTQLRGEQARLVRLYLYSALRGIGAKDSATLEELRGSLQALAAAKEEAEGIYTPADERIALASALYVLDDKSDHRPQYLREVTQWLQPPAGGLQGRDLDAFWDHRWMAVISVEHMRGAGEAIPLLEGMLHEKDRKPWVNVHVPRALGALRDSKKPPVSPME